MMIGGDGDAVESSGGGGVAGVAPFVAKTYGMVDDPATDGAVAWGGAGNSFVVADVSAFSQALLPAHFKHGNFSSFVRQLNAHGFRKVDPDRWEFAHASFLRGRTHLLRHVVRRRSGSRKDDGEEEDGGATTMLAMEVVRLKREQRAAEERLAAMWRRVREAERRPRLMLAFLLKAVGAGDPDALRRLVGGFHGGPDDEGAGAKRPRLLLDDGQAVQLASGDETTSSFDVDALLYEYDVGNMQEEVFVAEPGVDFTGSFYAGADGLCDVLLDGGAFPADSSY